MAYEGAVIDFQLQNLEQTNVLNSLKTLIPDTRFVCLYDVKECLNCDSIFMSQQHIGVDRNLEFSKLLSILHNYINLSSRNKSVGVGFGKSWPPLTPGGAALQQSLLKKVGQVL